MKVEIELSPRHKAMLFLAAGANRKTVTEFLSDWIEGHERDATVYLDTLRMHIGKDS